MHWQFWQVSDRAEILDLMLIIACGRLNIHNIQGKF